MGSGFLYVGGVPESYRSSLQWGAPQSSPPFQYHAFPLYSMQVCGVSLLPSSSVSSSFPLAGVVDTGSSCLTLPAELFDSLLSWIPAECDLLSNCYLPLHVRSILPDLSFTVASTGTALILPLADLLLRSTAAQGGRQPYCLFRGPSVAAANGSLIVFGSRALQNVVTAFNMNSKQVGVAGKQQRSPLTVQCKAAVKCMGLQTRDITVNTCVDPSCSDYYFYVLDPVTHTCSLSSQFHVTAIVLIVSFIVTELLLFEIRFYISRRVVKTVRGS